MDTVSIVSTGRYAPDTVIYTKDVIESEKIPMKTVEELAIDKVHVAIDEEASDMAIKASNRAINKAGIDPSQIDVVVYSNTMPDYLRWSDAARIAHEIGAVNAYAFRIEQFCCGGMAGLDFAYSKLKADPDTKTVLVVCSDKFSKPLINRWTSASANYYGDGASACIVQRSEKGFEIKGTHAKTDGSFNHLWKMPVGGLKVPATADHIRDNLFNSNSRASAAEYLNDESKRDELFTMLGKNNKLIMTELLDRLKVDQKDLSHMVLYNIGRDIMTKIIDIIGMDYDQTSMDLAKDYGHMGPTDIVFNLDVMLEENRFNNGDKIILFSAGAGFSWSSALLEYKGA